MKTIFSIFVIMAAMFTNIAFAQSASCDTETKKAKAIYDRCNQASASNYNNYNKCLEKYKVPSLLKQIKREQIKCSQEYQARLQEYQVQTTKISSDYTKCQESSGYTKCLKEYQTQTTEAKNDYKICFEANGYTQQCQQEYQAQTTKISSDYTECLKASDYTKCQQEYQTRLQEYQTRLMQVRKCSEENKTLSEQVTSGQTKCQHLQVKIDIKCLEEYQTQQAKADKICPRPVSPVYISELEKRGDIYFMKNKPYSGKVNCSSCTECDHRCDANMKDGKFHGKYSVVDDFSITGNYVDGKKQGEWKWSSYEMGCEENCNESYGVQYYKDDKEHGEWKSFYGSGELKSIERYNNGNFQESKTFYINGNLQSVSVINYKDGKEHGETKTFDYDGKLIKTENYIDGVKQE